MTSIYLGLALIVLIRGMSARLDFSYGRARSVFDQLLLRSCWFAIGLLLVLATALRLGVTSASRADDISLIVFLLGCAVLLELASLVIYRARLESTSFGGRLVCRNEYLGELKLDRENSELIFTMRAGPDGFSTHTNLGPGARGRAKTPGWLVNQVIVRLRGRALLKYLVVCETRSSARAEDIARTLASALGVPKLGDPGWLQEVQASSRDQFSSSSDDPNELMSLVLQLLDRKSPPDLEGFLAGDEPKPHGPDGESPDTQSPLALVASDTPTSALENEGGGATETASSQPALASPAKFEAEGQAQLDQEKRD